MRITGNKGEWSELYVLIRLLAEGKICSATENLQKNTDCYLPILKIFRTEEDSHKIVYVQNSSKSNIELYLNGTFVKKISVGELSKDAEYFYNAIVHGKGKGSFEIKNAEVMMENLKCKKIKAKSADKTDILMEVHDPFTNFNQVCGFSIKSDLGSPPTLFNASKSTNFKFEVLGLNDAEINKINKINSKSKIKDRVKRIPELSFVSVFNETFAKNLLFIDTQMEKILAEMLKIYYGENISECSTLASILDTRDFLGLGTKNLYPHKLKKFLCAVALGLKPTEQWNGTDEANGGYVIVKEDGEVLAYHLHNRDSFETYLLNHTKLETPSSSKHDFGNIYHENGKNFINLNLQVRFI